MCGIVGAVSTRNIVPILLEGLRRLEYRGYDSCGVAVHQNGELRRARSTSRVAELDISVAEDKVEGGTGIAHTRWATHGRPAIHNAHPHFSHGRIGQERAAMGSSKSDGTHCRRAAWSTTASSKTTTSCAPNSRPRAMNSTARPIPRSSPTWCDHLYTGDLLEAVQGAVKQLRGAYAHCRVLHADEPHRVVGAREGSPLVLGVGVHQGAGEPSWPATRWRWPA